MQSEYNLPLGKWYIHGITDQGSSGSPVVINSGGTPIVAGIVITGGGSLDSNSTGCTSLNIDTLRKAFYN